MGGLRFENRIFSTGHMTLMVDDGTPSEQPARVSDPDFPEHAVAYTRKVTMVWCAFFVFNGSMALSTVLFGDLAIWAFYNGFVSYALMALLFAGEYLLRQRILAK